MSKMHKAILSAALLVSVLALSACASKEKAEPVAAPAPVEAPAPVAAPEPAPAPFAAVAPVAPKPAVRKAKKIAKPVVAPPPPVETPAPVVQPEPPVVQPAAPVTVAPIEPAVPEAGFLEKYWLWLLALIVAVVGIVIFRSMSKGSTS